MKQGTYSGGVKPPRKTKSTTMPNAPAASPLPATFLRRALAYASATGIRFEATLRHAGYGAFGLPDLRGFTPYRRTIRRFADESPAFPRAADTPMDELTTDELWLLHDLLHVVWYDFATLLSGAAPRERWATRDFFVEHHLASEAFAVILLDYQVLSATRHQGLAVEVSDAAWSGLRAALPALPPLRSPELARELVRHYLTGKSRLFGAAQRDDSNAAVAAWAGHEVRYSDKQRWYVLLWWDDLRGAPSSNRQAQRQAVVERSSVAAPLWRAVELFTTAPESEFTHHLEQAAAALAGQHHLFAALPKFRGELPPDPDFRFTDVAALPVDAVAEQVRTAERPCAEHLFLLWQTLALEPPSTLQADERAAITALARSVQTPKVDRRAWRLVRELCLRRVAHARWLPDASLRGAFFLP
jgi:hypothetical protein